MRKIFNKFYKCIVHPYKILLFLDEKGIFRLSDKMFLKLKYKDTFGKEIDFLNAVTFNEKIQWLKLYNRKNIYTIMVDKYEVKRYVSSIIGEKYIIQTLGIYDKFDDINFDSLPDKFVMKCTHDSGGLIICDEKNKFNIDKAKKIINKSLKHNYYYKWREWPYKNVKRRIIIEKYMGNNLNDYKIFCFNGEPKFTLVCSNRHGNEKNTDFYDNEWNLMSFTRANHNNNPNGICKPKKLNEMLRIAKTLSSDIPFVRVDLYDIDDKIYFGELTFYPSSGFESFNPEEWDYKLGQMITLPKDGV